MNAPQSPIPDLDELMRRIRHEVDARRAGESPTVDNARVPLRAVITARAPAPAAVSPVAAARWHPGGTAFKPAARYALADLIAFHDEDFIDAAYRAVLHRGADAAGKSHYLHELRTGALAKPEILGRLRYSPEGRARGTRIDGLFLTFVLHHLRRIPVLGYPFAVAIGVANLPVLFRNVRAIEAYNVLQQRELGRVVNSSIAREADRDQRIESAASAQREGIAALDALRRDAAERREETKALARQAELLRGSVAWRADVELLRHQGEAIRDTIARAAAGAATLTDALRDSMARIDALDQAMTSHVSADAFEALVATIAEQRDGILRELAANRAEIDAARAGYEAYRTALEALRAEVDAERATLEAKAAQTTVDTMAQRLDALHAVVDAERASLEAKAAQTAVDAMAQRLEALHAIVDAERASLEAKAAQTAVDSIAQRLDALDAESERIRTALAGKADAVALRDLASSVDAKVDVESVQAVAARLDAKADRVPLQELAARIDEKADVTLVRALAERVDVKADGADLQHRAERLASDLAATARALREVERKVAALLARPSARKSGEPAGPAAAQRAHLHDAFYATFEDTFRGSPEEIARRVAYYLPEVRASGAGAPDAPVLDLGAGRGEWLDLLGREGLAARGIDTNRVLVEEGRSRGLSLEVLDAVAALRATPEESLGAVTAMHLVEHVDLEALLAMLDESYRALRPGGILILETPNPENLLVSTRYFYLDPTHRNPLPPALLRYLVESRGFVRARIEGLAADRGSTALERVNDAMPAAEQINAFVDLVSQPPDYAVIAYRP